MRDFRDCRLKGRKEEGTWEGRYKREIKEIDSVMIKKKRECCNIENKKMDIRL